MGVKRCRVIKGKEKKLWLKLFIMLLIFCFNFFFVKASAHLFVHNVFLQHYIQIYFPSTVSLSQSQFNALFYLRVATKQGKYKTGKKLLRFCLSFLQKYWKTSLLEKHLCKGRKCSSHAFTKLIPVFLQGWKQIHQEGFSSTCRNPCIDFWLDMKEQQLVL